MSAAVEEDPRLEWLRADVARAVERGDRYWARLMAAHERIGALTAELNIERKRAKHGTR